MWNGLQRDWGNGIVSIRTVSKNHCGACHGEDNKIEETKEDANGIGNQDGFVGDNVIGEGLPPYHAVEEEDRDGVYNTVQQVSAWNGLEICNVVHYQFLCHLLVLNLIHIASTQKVYCGVWDDYDKPHQPEPIIFSAGVLFHAKLAEGDVHQGAVPAHSGSAQFIDNK